MELNPAQKKIVKEMAEVLVMHGVASSLIDNMPVNDRILDELGEDLYTAVMELYEELNIGEFSGETYDLFNMSKGIGIGLLLKSKEYKMAVKETFDGLVQTISSDKLL